MTLGSLLQVVRVLGGESEDVSDHNAVEGAGGPHPDLVVLAQAEDVDVVVEGVDGEASDGLGAVVAAVDEHTAEEAAEVGARLKLVHRHHALEVAHLDHVDLTRVVGNGEHGFVVRRQVGRGQMRERR